MTSDLVYIAPDITENETSKTYSCVQYARWE